MASRLDDNADRQCSGAEARESGAPGELIEQDGRGRTPVPLVLAFSLLSGGVALAYEILWTRELLNILGSTTRASALVLTAFMGGIAFGAWVAGRWPARLPRPLLLFAAAEGLLALLAFAFPAVLERAGTLLPGVAAASLLLMAVLFAPAVLMGIALPVLAATLQGQGAAHPRYVAWLYGLNTIGGGTAVLAVGLGALPSFGLLASERGVAALGLALAVFAIAVRTGSRPWPPRIEQTARHEAGTKPSERTGGVMAVLFLSGIAALGYEVLWTRILVLVVGSSTNAFTLMLGLYLLGLAVGGFLIGRWSGWARRPAMAYQILQLGVAAAALSGVALFSVLPTVALVGFAWLGASPWSIAAVNFVVSALVILPPTIFIGASFPVAARLMQRGRPQRGAEVGLALALTTAGNVAGILLAAFVVIPLAGLQGGVAVLATLNLAAAVLLWAVSRDPTAASPLRYLAPLGALGGLAALPVLPSWDVSVMTSGVFRQAPVYLALLGSPERLDRAFAAYRTRYYREGQEAVVAVFDRPTLNGAPHRVLTIDGKVDASTGADMATQILSGHLPLLFRPDARNALVVGLASGVTVGALARHPFERIEVVEIEPAVVEASREFDAVSAAPLEDPRVTITVADGRRFLRTTGRRFDIIVSEPSNPWLSMSARLFTREFFELARGRLDPRGVLVQWIPLYGLSTRQFEALLRTVLDVFPSLALFQVAEGDLVAIAGKSALTLDPAALDALFEDDRAGWLEPAGIRSPVDLIARWVADAPGLRAVLGPGPLNTDDNGLLEFGSPWHVLSDTRPANLAIVERAWAHTSVPQQLVALGDARDRQDEFYEALAERYLARNRPDIAGALAEALRPAGHEALADLVAGDAAYAEGHWQEAEAFWAAHDAPPFWLRRARLALRLNDLPFAVNLFAEVPESERTPEDEVLFALALAGTERVHDALGVLETVGPAADTAPGIIAPFLMSALLERLGRREDAAAERRRFEGRLDALRRCLEVEGCSRVSDILLAWGDNNPSGVDPAAWDQFRQAVFLRMTRPLPHYFEGVRSLWLGEHAKAATSFQTYLALLPAPDPLSKGHAFLHELRPAAGRIAEPSSGPAVAGQ